MFTVLSAVRLISAISWRGTLGSYMAPWRVVYTAITGAAWMLAGAYALWSFWRGDRQSRWVILGAAGAYAAWSWADRLFVQTSLPPNWPFALVATVILLAFVAAVALDARYQSYFRKETYERKPEKSTTP